MNWKTASLQEKPPTWHLNRLTQPQTELLSVADAKRHLRVDEDLIDEDDDIAEMIVAAREACEDHTRRGCGACDYELVLDYYPAGIIELPVYPLLSVTSIRNIDSSGVETVLSPDTYAVDVDRMPGAVFPRSSWPSFSPMPGAAVRIAFSAGHTDATIPKRMRQAIKLLVGHWYAHREENTEIKLYELPMGVKALLAPLKVW